MHDLPKFASKSDIPEGTCKQIDVGGAKVALFNVNGTIHAIGGTCTHQGGPLGEGDLDGSIVTCPWHGAQFDVTTGKVVGPPAMKDVPQYQVVVDGDDVHIDITSS